MCRFYFIGTAGHPGHVKVSDTEQESKEAHAQGWELLKNGVIKKKEKEKKSRTRLEPQGRDTLPRRCSHILTLLPLMRAEGASGNLNREAGGTSNTGLRPAPPSRSVSEEAAQDL